MRVTMACKKWCSSSQAKWTLAGSVSVTLVLAISMILGLTLHRGTHPGRTSPLPAHFPNFSSLTSLSSAHVPGLYSALILQPYQVRTRRYHLFSPVQWI